MPKLRSIEDLTNYCLVRLGQGVVKINVTEEQACARLEDAIQFFLEHHYDGSSDVFYEYTLRDADIRAEYIDISNVSENIVTVNRLVPMISGGQSNLSWMSYEYQARYGNRGGFRQFNLANAVLRDNFYDMVNRVFDRTQAWEHSKYSQKLRIYTDWSCFTAGDKIAFEVTEVLDGDENDSFYNDPWLKNYATACLREQWGDNVKLFDEVKLPGGLSINGRAMYEDAVAAKEKLETELRDIPLGMYFD